MIEKKTRDYRRGGPIMEIKGNSYIFNLQLS